MFEDNVREMQSCSLCDKYVKSLSKIAETWLVEEIKKDHPDWVSDNAVCIKCIEYYYGLLDNVKVVN